MCECMYMYMYMCIYTSFLYFITRCILYISIQYICVCGNICICIYIYAWTDYAIGRIYSLPLIHYQCVLHISVQYLCVYAYTCVCIYIYTNALSL